MAFAGSNYNQIDIDGYLSRFENGERDYLLLDVREVEEFAAGRMPGAVNIPMNDVPARIAEVPTDRPIVLVCARGSRSALVAEFLSRSGYTDLYNLVDGTFGWMLRRLPMER
jgi:rhodanese-related sulfurtransferase